MHPIQSNREYISVMHWSTERDSYNMAFKRSDWHGFTPTYWMTEYSQQVSSRDTIRICNTFCCEFSTAQSLCRFTTVSPAFCFRGRTFDILRCISQMVFRATDICTLFCAEFAQVKSAANLCIRCCNHHLHYSRRKTHTHTPTNKYQDPTVCEKGTTH